MFATCSGVKVDLNHHDQRGRAFSRAKWEIVKFGNVVACYLTFMDIRHESVVLSIVVMGGGHKASSVFTADRFPLKKKTYILS